MSTDYFTYGDSLVPHTTARSADVAAEFQSVETGLAKLPSEAELKQGKVNHGVDTGAADAYVVTLPYTPTLEDGLEISFTPINDNAGASTVNPNTLGDVAIKRQDGSDLSALDLNTTGSVTLRHNGTVFVLTSPSSSDLTATAADATATAADRVQTGLDATATAADRVQTGLDATATAADVVTTNADVVSTNADAVSTAADAADTVVDAAATAADAVSTDADATATAADAVSTDADATATAADAVSTDADATAAAASATAAAASESAAATSATQALAAAQGWASVSPITAATTNLEVTDARDYYVLDATSNTVTVSMPAIGTSDGILFGFEVSNVDNAITIVRDGSDTINGVAGDYTGLISVGQVIHFIGDDASPDNWLATIISQVNPATETSEGIVELATQAEVNTGTDTTRSITPATLDAFVNGKTDTAITAADGIVFADATDSNKSKKDTVQGILDLVSGFPAPDFTSAEQTVALDTLLDVPHSLGSVPTLYTVVLRCKTTQHGYAVDDEITVVANANAADQNATFSADATNITVVSGANIAIHSQSTFNIANITLVNFAWVIRAWS